MKTIQNKKMTLPALKNGEEIKLETSYFEQIKTAIKQAPQGGFDFDTLEKVSKVMPLLKTGEGFTNDFEDADVEFIKKRIEETKWLLYDEDGALLEFLKYIKSL
jgi:hypothetical protein